MEHSFVEYASSNEDEDDEINFLGEENASNKIWSTATQRKEMILEAQRDDRNRRRAAYLPVAGDPSLYSSTQLSNFLRGRYIMNFAIIDLVKFFVFVSKLNKQLRDTSDRISNLQSTDQGFVSTSHNVSDQQASNTGNDGDDVNWESEEDTCEVETNIPNLSSEAALRAVSTASKMTDWAGKVVERVLRQHLSVENNISAAASATSTDPASPPLTVEGNESSKSSDMIVDDTEADHDEIDRSTSVGGFPISRHTSGHNDLRNEMISLLQAMDIPYMIAPFEAEAQCAVLEQVILRDFLGIERLSFIYLAWAS